MNRIPVKLAGNGYDILVEAGAFEAISKHLLPHIRKDRIFLITDANVAASWLKTLETDLRKSGIAVISHVLPAGEQTKSWTNWVFSQSFENTRTYSAVGNSNYRKA